MRIEEKFESYLLFLKILKMKVGWKIENLKKDGLRRIKLWELTNQNLRYLMKEMSMWQSLTNHLKLWEIELREKSKLSFFLTRMSISLGRKLKGSKLINRLKVIFIRNSFRLTKKIKKSSMRKLEWEKKHLKQSISNWVLFSLLESSSRMIFANLISMKGIELWRRKSQIILWKKSC